MMTTSKHAHASTQHHSDWYFLPSMFSGTAGIMIGLAIASIFGWVQVQIWRNRTIWRIRSVLKLVLPKEPFLNLP